MATQLLLSFDLLRGQILLQGRKLFFGCVAGSLSFLKELEHMHRQLLALEQLQFAAELIDALESLGEVRQIRSQAVDGDAPGGFSQSGSVVGFSDPSLAVLDHREQTIGDDAELPDGPPDSLELVIHVFQVRFAITGPNGAGLPLAW